MLNCFSSHGLLPFYKVLWSLTCSCYYFLKCVNFLRAEKTCPGRQQIYWTSSPPVSHSTMLSHGRRGTQKRSWEALNACASVDLFGLATMAGLTQAQWMDAQQGQMPCPAPPPPPSPWYYWRPQKWETILGIWREEAAVTEITFLPPADC